MKSLINFWIERELIKEIDKAIEKSNNRYKDRTQFLILAIQEKLKGEKEK